MEYQNDIIYNPQHINHHSANVGHTKYINLKKHCELIMRNDIKNEDVQSNVKTFELVLYQKIGEENEEVEDDHLFDICPTQSSRTKKNPFCSDKGFFQKTGFKTGTKKSPLEYLDNDSQKKDLTLDAKKFVEGINQHQQQISNENNNSSFRIGIVDGLHRLTAFHSIITQLAKEDKDFQNIKCNCYIFTMKPDTCQKDPMKFQTMFYNISEKISSDNQKAITHTLFDSISEIYFHIDSKENICYAEDIIKNSLSSFAGNYNKKKQPNRSICADKYKHIFRFSQRKLIQCCPEYRDQFLKYNNGKDDELFDEEYLDLNYHAVLQTPHPAMALAPIFNKTVVQHSLHKKAKFCLSCASVHRLLSAYMTGEDFSRKVMTNGLDRFQQNSMANLLDIQLIVAYAEILAKSLTDNVKSYTDKRSLNLGEKTISHLLSNYFIYMMFKGIWVLDNWKQDDKDKIFKEWKMTNISDITIGDNQCCNTLSEEFENSVSKEGKNDYMTMIGIYFNYANNIFKQPFFAEHSDTGIVKTLKMQPKDVKQMKCKENEYSTKIGIPEKLELTLHSNNNESATSSTSSSQKKEFLPITFINFLEKIRKSTLPMYEVGGEWEIFHPNKVLARYVDYKDLKKSSGSSKKTNKSLVVDDVPYTNFSDWKDFAENDKDYYFEYTPEIKAQKIIEVTSKIIKMFETKYGATKNIQKIIEKIFGPEEDKDYDASTNGDNNEDHEEDEDESSDGEDEENRKDGGAEENDDTESKEKENGETGGAQENNDMKSKDKKTTKRSLERKKKSTGTSKKTRISKNEDRTKDQKNRKQK